MVHGARRESLGGWNEISYSWGIRSDPSLISRKRNSKARSCAAESFPRPGRPGRDGSHSESLSKTPTSGRRSNVMPRLYHCPARLLHMDLTGEVTAGGRHFCSTFVHRGATSHMVESYSNMREQPMRPAKHPSTVLCLCPTRPCNQSASPAPCWRSVLLGLASRPGIYRESPRDRSE